MARQPTAVVMGRYHGFLVTTTVLLSVAAGAVIVHRPWGEWREYLPLKQVARQVEQYHGGAIVPLAGSAPVVGMLVLPFLIPYLCGAAPIRPQRARAELKEPLFDDAVTAVTERLNRLGMVVSIDDLGDSLRLTATGNAANPYCRTSMNQRARRVVVHLSRESSGIVADGVYSFTHGDGVGIDTGEGDYARAVLRYIMGTGPLPTGEIHSVYASLAFCSAMVWSGTLVLARAGLMAAPVGIMAGVAGGLFTLICLLLATTVTGWRRISFSPDLTCAWVMAASAGLLWAHGFLPGM